MTAEIETKNLRPLFRQMLVDQAKRTGFKTERIDSFLPPDLRQAFTYATGAGGRLANDDVGQRLYNVVEKDIYGVLPDYKSKALSEQVNGFFILGKPVAITMARDTVQRQIGMIVNKVDRTILTTKATEILKGLRTPLQVHDTILLSGRLALDRQLVAGIVKAYEDICSTPPILQ